MSQQHLARKSHTHSEFDMLQLGGLLLVDPIDMACSPFNRFLLAARYVLGMAVLSIEDGCAPLNRLRRCG